MNIFNVLSTELPTGMEDSQGKSQSRLLVSSLWFRSETSGIQFSLLYTVCEKSLCTCQK